MKSNEPLRQLNGPDAHIVRAFVALQMPQGSSRRQVSIRKNCIVGKKLMVECHVLRPMESNWVLREIDGFGRLATNDNGTISWHGDSDASRPPKVQRCAIRHEILDSAQYVFDTSFDIGVQGRAASPYDERPRFDELAIDAGWRDEYEPDDQLILNLKRLCAEVFEKRNNDDDSP